MEEAGPEDMFPARVGERLAEARRKAKLEVGDIATRTRIPLRHIEALEDGRYDELPARTYAIGFAKSYARTLQMDEVAIARDLRAELGMQGSSAAPPEFFEPADPSRVPSRTLAWTAALIGVLLVVGYLILTNRGDELGGRDATAVAAGSETLEPPPAAPLGNAAAPSPAAAPATGEVVLTATDTVWLRITDAAGQRLYEKEMARGERFQVPPDAREPKILTGRPDVIAVTVGGRPVAPLGPPETTIRDVGISAAALAARPAAPAVPASNAAAPVGRP